MWSAVARNELPLLGRTIEWAEERSDSSERIRRNRAIFWRVEVELRVRRSYRFFRKFGTLKCSQPMAFKDEVGSELWVTCETIESLGFSPILSAVRNRTAGVQNHSGSLEPLLGKSGFEKKRELCSRTPKVRKPPFGVGLWGTSWCYAENEHWKQLMLFDECFHGDKGRGCGVSHQTGWTVFVLSSLSASCFLESEFVKKSWGGSDRKFWELLFQVG